MLTIKRDLSFGLSICALVFVCALAWGRPFVNNNRAHHGTRPVQATDTALSGTIVRQGNHWIVQESSGETFQLDDPAQVSAFNRKTVEITGRLDERSGTIHVIRIALGAD